MCDLCVYCHATNSMTTDRTQIQKKIYGVYNKLICFHTFSNRIGEREEREN